MELGRFIFWTAMKTLSLVFLGLLAAKAVSALQVQKSKQLPWLRGVLYIATIVLVGLGARSLGYDVASENYARTSQMNLAEGQLDKAHSNALRAVELRPGVLRYWQALARAKFALRQFNSLVRDEPVFLSLSGGELDEEGAYRVAASYYFLAQYDLTTTLTREMIKKNRAYAAPYVLQGYAYTAERRYAEAERTFLEVLQMFPTQQSAVEGLAHLYFIAGNTAGSLAVLEQTSKFRFPTEARQRFEDLKALYAQ